MIVEKLKHLYHATRGSRPLWAGRPWY